eukprot:g885.t1
MCARSVLRNLTPSMVTGSVLRRGQWNSVITRGETSVPLASRRGMSALEELRQERQAEIAGTGPTIVQKIEYERPLKVISYPDPKLRLPNAKIRLPAEGVEELAKDMFEVMYNDDGIGLAAPQVGVNVQMIVFNPDGPPAKGDESKEMVLINPRIIKLGNETEVDNEGCLSFYKPVHINGDIERSISVKIKAQNLKGEKMTLVLKELPARIFQHEYDHLQGVLFFERMSPEVLATVKADLIRYEEEYLTKNPDVKIQRIQT